MGSHSADAALAGKDVILIYFSAHWCPPCRGFTPVLKDFYEEVESEGVEIIFVSSDRSPADMVSYMKESHGDWYGVEHGSDLAQGLKQKFGVSGIPCLVLSSLMEHSSPKMAAVLFREKDQLLSRT